MSEFCLPDMPEQAAEKYRSPYAEQAREKSSELGPGSDNYPYTVNAVVDDHKIELNGMKHINDPGDKSIERLEARLDDFVQSSKSPLVFIEGGIPDVVGLDSDTALRKSGEPGFIAKLVQERKIEVLSPEPPDTELINELLNNFSAEEVVQFFFERRLYQWYRMKDLDQSIGNREQYIKEGILDKLKQVNGLESVPADYAYYLHKLEERLGEALDEMKDDDIRKRLNFDMSPFGNRVSALTSDIRDKYLMARIVEAARDGRDVFVVYGSHHVFVLEQMLENGDV